MSDKSWTVKKLIFNSPIRELDATLLQLDRRVPGVEPYPIAPALPDRNGPQRLYVVGHPPGQRIIIFAARQLAPGLGSAASALPDANGARQLRQPGV